ncbi:hypothetical protein VTJ04DRAFT_9951 [Mycothermus thermophilus]|uniref:uncharacterized protein n=1 Tax=Humicola insolens TaxID=85995 RepID=UPI0037430BCE
MRSRPRRPARSKTRPMTRPRPQTVGWLLLPLLATVDGVGAVAAHAARDAGADAASTDLDVAAVETAALFPREYYLAPGLPAQKLQARQAGCQPGTHPCHDIGPAGEGICCPNDMYCVINPSNFTAACCAIGSHCGSPCSASLYQCLTTSTITLSSTRTVNIQTRAAALHPRQEPLTTTTVLSACCPRRCPSTSQFLCATTAGAGCCGYGATCTTSAGTGLCVPTDDPSTIATNTVDPTLIAPPGCETGQISCAASLGGGCCAATQVCTLVSGGVYCAETAPAAADVVDEDGGGLATGAIAGIAVGAVVGVAVLLGVVVWWLRRRREGGGGGQGHRRGERREWVDGKTERDGRVGGQDYRRERWERRDDAGEA